MCKHYSHLNIEERTMIQLGLEQGLSLSEIGNQLGRSTSTISREINRNGWVSPMKRLRQRGRPPVAGGYRSVGAQQRADGLARKARKQKRLFVGGELWGRVESLLRDFHSPEQIACRLERMNTVDSTLRVSHATINTAIYAMPRGELRKELISCLR